MQGSTIVRGEPSRGPSGQDALHGSASIADLAFVTAATCGGRGGYLVQRGTETGDGGGGGVRV